MANHKGLVIGLSATGLIGGLLVWNARRNREPSLMIGDELGGHLALALRAFGLQINAQIIGGEQLSKPSVMFVGLTWNALNASTGLVLISLGANDALRGVTPSKASKAVKDLLAKVTGDERRQIAWIAPPFGTVRNATIEAIRDAVLANGKASWIDTQSGPFMRPLEPTKAEAEAWADKVLEQLSEHWTLALDDASTLDAFAAESMSGDRPDVTPPPPAVVTVPKGWQRVKALKVTRPIRVWMLNTLARRLPYGDLQVATFENRDLGALTDTHYDDHVNGTWMWHPGISVLERQAP